MKPTAPKTLLSVSAPPHTHAGTSVRGIMRDVLIALTPVLTASVLRFGWNAVRLVVLCTSTCMLTEALCRRLMRRRNTVCDLSAAVTGVLLAFNLPPALPGWMAVLGSVFAIAIVKQTFGGLGYNPFNPALMARAFLLISFTGAMTSWTAWQAPFAEGITTATPLGLFKDALQHGRPLPYATDGALTRALFLGEVNGCLGETSALALIVGGLYLLCRRIITWHIPVAYLLSVALYAAVLRLAAPGATLPVHIHLFSGGVMLAALFMATDMVTSPVSARGMLLFGVGCGLLTMVLRTASGGAYPEGASFAVLLMNAATPLIDRWTRPSVFGKSSKGAKA